MEGKWSERNKRRGREPEFLDFFGCLSEQNGQADGQSLRPVQELESHEPLPQSYQLCSTTHIYRSRPERTVPFSQLFDSNSVPTISSDAKFEDIGSFI